MEEKRYGVATPVTGRLLDVLETSELEALRSAAKLMHSSRSARAVGQVMLDGFRVVEVKLVPA